LIETLGLDQRVIFTGWLEKKELWKIFRAADLFVLPSKSEGMPNAMLEALGFGLPCIGSKVPGIIDVLQYEELMFDPMDEQSLIDKIRHLFSDFQYLHEMKTLCQDRRKTFIFDWKKKVFQVVTQGMLS
jgi:glycosyltransferase involved in cell wall biosynthesis